MGLSRQVITALDRPGARWLLSGGLPFVGRFTAGGVSGLRYDNGWIHQFGNRTVVEPRPRVRGRELSDAANRDYTGYLYTPKAGDTVLDIGSHLGWETFYFSEKVGPSGRVISVEAQPTIFALLERSVRLNGLSNVTPLNLAASDKREIVSIEVDIDAHLGNALTASGDASVQVQADTLDAICAEHDVRAIDLLKMNIEGAERPALRGATDIIDRVKVLCVSCHDFKFARTGVEFFRTKAVVREFLTDHGFVIVDRISDKPWIADQINAYNPTLIDRPALNH